MCVGVVVVFFLIGFDYFQFGFVIGVVCVLCSYCCCVSLGLSVFVLMFVCCL